MNHFILIDLFFLFSFKATTGIFTGCFGIVLNSSALIVLVPLLIYNSFFYDENDEVIKNMQVISIVFIAVAILLTTYNLKISKLLLDNVKKRDSEIVRRWLIISAVITVVECLAVLSGHFLVIQGIIFGNITISNMYDSSTH